ncbi:MAG: esterase family protein [Actinomycetota bacterium]
MQRAHELVANEAMGRPYHLWRYGSWGQPLVVFPSAAGFAHEWDAQGMIEALSPLIDGGRLKLYCTESNVAEAFTRREHDPAWRIQRHLVFERYVTRELAAFVRADCRSETIAIAATGCSLGAYYAANFALRHPETFGWALCMSGRYDIRHFLDGFSNADVYSNNPLSYVRNLEGEALERVRRHTYVQLVCGQGAYEEGCIEETQALGDLLAAKAIPSHKDIWGHDVRHDWDWWRRQAVYHLTKRFGG